MRSALVLLLIYSCTTVYGCTPMFQTLGEFTSTCNYSYNSNDHNGPENWHTSCPGWEICKSGKFQSPINIVTENASKISSIENRINASFVQVGNSGSVKDLSHTVEFAFKQELSREFFFNPIDKKSYRIEQFHFHAPSDHKIDGKSFDLELHIVTRSHDSKNLSVFSLLFNAGTKVNEFFSDFLSSPLPTNGAESEKDISTVLFQAELQKALFDGYFYYEGSLTIPPCTEQVQWHICATPLTALQSQIDAISKAKGVSSRPVQQLNGRVVSKYSLSNAAGYNGVSWMLAGFAVMMSIFFCVFCICL